MYVFSLKLIIEEFCFEVMVVVRLLFLNGLMVLIFGGSSSYLFGVLLLLLLFVFINVGLLFVLIKGKLSLFCVYF